MTDRPPSWWWQVEQVASELGVTERFLVQALDIFEERGLGSDFEVGLMKGVARALGMRLAHLRKLAKLPAFARYFAQPGGPRGRLVVHVGELRKAIEREYRGTGRPLPFPRPKPSPSPLPPAARRHW